MRTRYSLALVIWLVAAPVAAQPPLSEPRPVSPSPAAIPLAPASVPNPAPAEPPLPVRPPAAPRAASAVAAALLPEPAGFALAFELLPVQDGKGARAGDQRERQEAQLYTEGQNAAAELRYDRALALFDRVVALNGSRVDAALYWKAYAQNRLGQRAEALTTLAILAKNHPNSSYRTHANALEAEVRRDIGQPVQPQDSADDEVKLMALQGLQHTDPERAVPLLEKVLAGTSGPKIKQRAMFVLAQSPSPRAREVLRNYAKGSATPELQIQAIQYLGVHGGAENRVMLAEVYSSSTDIDIKRRILRAFMVAGDRDRLLKAAEGEAQEELRREAVNQLGVMGAHDELWQLYQKESALEVRRSIIRAMHVGGNATRLIELARTEKHPELRRDAVKTLGLLGAARTGDALVQIYHTDSTLETRRTVINSLFIQDNASALVTLARAEKDQTLRKELVSKLSLMRNKEALDYMLEILGQ